MLVYDRVVTAEEIKLHRSSTPSDLG